MKSDYTKYKRNGAIAFLDILGFKGNWKRREPEEILETIKDIQGMAFTHVQGKLREGKQRYGLNIKDIIMLYDTIVIEAEGDNFKNLMRSLSLVIQHTFLVFLQQKFPLRGAVSFGEYYRIEYGGMGANRYFTSFRRKQEWTS